jgi:DNA-binding GntR family transcriptional regulator
VTATNRNSRPRLAYRGLASLLLDHLNTYPGQDFSPYDLAKVLGRSHGAIRTRLLTLADAGQVIRSRTRPARFRIARPTP